jgi:two-component system phosphate regulon response regulator PhoB
VAVASLLIVEDEPDLQRIMEFNLRQAGHRTRVAPDAERAMALIRQEKPDLILLDLMLPDLPGTELCKQLKRAEATRRIPIIMVTARGDEVDRVVGFELGADDFVPKPFSVRELILRVGAVLRRAAGEPKRVDRIGTVRLDAESHRCFVGEEEVVLTALEFKLLQAFFDAQGRVLTREHLLQAVWELNAETQTRTVDTHVKRLREKLGPARDLIETLRGVGYRLALPEDR